MATMAERTLGKSGKVAFDVPISVVTQKLAFLGRTGSGKSYAATKLAEMMLSHGAQVVALDPVGIWWGLRLNRDGKRPGFDIPVFGGLHGDVPLEPTGGAFIADLIVDRGISVVLDVSQFESDAEKARFAADFANRFFFRKKAAPAAVHVFVEECQEFVPQNPQKGEERMLHAFTRLEKLGRNFGIGVSLISQRPQEVNKKALNMTECLFAFQMTGPQERKTVEDWIATHGLNADIRDLLPTFEVGTAHVWSPQWLRFAGMVQIGKKDTFDASSTPEVGTAAKAHQLAPIDLERIRADMAATIEKAKAEDPKELHRQIAELKKEIAKTPAVADWGDAFDAMSDDRDRWRQRAEAAERLLVERQSLLVGFVGALSRVRVDLDQIESKYSELAAATPTVAQSNTVKIRTPASPESQPVPSALLKPASNGNGAGTTAGVTKPQQNILDVLAGFEQIGLREPDRSTVAIFADQSPRSSGYSNNLGRLRTLGLIDYPGGGTLRLTDEGRVHAVVRGGISSLAQLQEAWLSRIDVPKRRILEQLIAVYPRSLDRTQLAEVAGQSPTSSGYANNLGFLRNSLGLIDYPGPAKVVATARLFPEGLS